MFGSVGIREGYEIGEHGAQSLYRIGVRMQLTEIEENPDGTFEVVAVGVERIQLDRMEPGDLFPVGHVIDRPDPEAPVAEAILEERPDRVHRLPRRPRRHPQRPYSGTLPRDPTYLSWTLAAVAPLPMPERQSLLEAEDAAVRLVMVTDLLRAELRAMNVIPSLPATEVARTRWSPN